MRIRSRSNVLGELCGVFDRWARDTDAEAQALAETGRILHAAELRAAARAYRTCGEFVCRALLRELHGRRVGR